jgi:HlyD family secretion protein
MKKKTIWIGAAATLAAVAALAWAFAPRPLPVDVAQARFGPFETTLEEDARTRLAERYVISAPLAGRLQRLTLREGDAVEAGAPLAALLPVLSPMLDERTLAELAARVGAAEAGRARARTRSDAARVALEKAELELRRTAELATQGFVATTKADADRLSVAAARKEVESAQEGERIARHEHEQARAALGAVRGASASLAGGAARGSVFVLRAPVAGRVLKVNQRSEAVLPLGAPILELGDTARLEIVAELLTTDALQAAPGSMVRIERWGGNGTLLGRVRLVEPGAFTKVSALGVEEQRVNVVIDLTSPRIEWAALGDGYRVTLRIVTRTVGRALTVPVSAVFPRPNSPAGDAAQHAVFAVEEGRARLRPVRLAARNTQQAWLADGEGVAPTLGEGASVIVYPGAQINDGVRVRAR